MRKFNVPCADDTLKRKVKNSEAGNDHRSIHFQHLLSKETLSNSFSRDGTARYQILKKERQRTYNVTLRRVRATTVTVEKSISVTQPECVFVALGTQHAMRMRHIVICGPPRSKMFSHIISKTARFSKQGY